MYIFFEEFIDNFVEIKTQIYKVLKLFYFKLRISQRWALTFLEVKVKLKR